MIRKHPLTCLFLFAAALPLLLLFLAPTARGGEEGTASVPRAREATETAGLSRLVARIRRAVSDPTADGFRLVFVASEDGTYFETFGELEPEAAIDLGRRLHALGDLMEASADLDHEDELDEDNDEFEDEDEEEGDDEDDDE